MPSLGADVNHSAGGGVLLFLHGPRDTALARVVPAGLTARHLGGIRRAHRGEFHDCPIFPLG